MPILQKKKRQDTEVADYPPNLQCSFLCLPCNCCFFCDFFFPGVCILFLRLRAQKSGWCSEGCELCPSPWYTVSIGVVVAFAEASQSAMDLTLGA